MKAAAVACCALVVILPGLCNGADVFYLTDAAAHTNYGPFEYVHGGKVTVGNQALEIRRLLTDDERVRYRLQKIIIPEVDFRGAALSNVVGFLQSAAAQYERMAEEGTNAIRFILPGQGDGLVPGPEDPGNKVIDAAPWRYVSLYTALREVCRLADLDFRVQDGAVVLMRRKPGAGQQPAGERRDEPAPRP